MLCAFEEEEIKSSALAAPGNISGDIKHKLLNNNQCPLDKDELGSKTWAFLHTMAAYYPERPSLNVQRDMNQFFRLFSQFYPCSHCAEDFTQMIDKRPPDTTSQANLSQWLCWAHNNVNKKLGKPEFDCSLVDQRWLTGWNDGSCG